MPSYQWILTLEKPGYASMTCNGVYTPPTGTTRHDAFTTIKQAAEEDSPQLAGAIVVFFSLEPDRL